MSIYEYDEEKHMRFVREEGLEQGLVRKLIEMVVKKLRRNKTPEMIAEELEEPIEQIAAICEAARPYAPDYDCQSIYQALVGEKR